MARTFGVGHLNAGLLEHLPVEQITEEFAGLCDRVGPELTVALEFMPYSGVPDLATTGRILRDAGRANGAVIVDVWHWARGGSVPGHGPKHYRPNQQERGNPLKYGGTANERGHHRTKKYRRGLPCIAQSIDAKSRTLRLWGEPPRNETGTCRE